MPKTRIRSLFNKLVAVVMTVAMVGIYIPTSIASATTITAAHKIVIGSSAPSAVTTYAVTFQVPTTGTIVKSVSFVPVTTPTGSTTPTGFSGTGATAAQPSSAGLGDTTGWTTTDSTSTELRLAKSGNVALPTATPVTVTFSTVTNPNTPQTFFVKINTFSGTYGTGALDSGVVAAATANQVQVTAQVDEALAFTVSGTTASLGTITTGTTGSHGTLTMTASTNANSGYSLTYTGTTLTGPSGTIPGYVSGLNGVASPAVGTAGFGFNLVANTVPTSLGAAPSGTGTGTVSASPQYNAANTYRFNSGDAVASASGATNSNTYTLSYIANISGATPSGLYSSTISYVATPNF